MSISELFQSHTIGLIIHFLIFIFSLISIILSIGVVWQSERHLDMVYKLFTAGLIVFGFSELLNILQIIEVLTAPLFNDILTLFFIFFTTVALYMMNKTLREVWKEKK